MTSGCSMSVRFRRLIALVAFVIAPSVAFAQTAASPQVPFGTVYKNYNPGGIPQINWSNKLTKGLAFLWVTIGGLQHELVHNLYGTDTGDVPISTPYGYGTLFQSTSTGAAFSSFPGVVTDNGTGTGNFTVFALANPVASSTLATSLLNVTTGVAGFIWWTNNDQNLVSTSGKLDLNLTDGTANCGIASSGAVIDGSYHLFATEGNGGSSTGQVYLDGKSQATTLSCPSIGSITQTGMIVADNFFGQPSFNVVIAGVYNRTLGVVDESTLAAMPFSLVMWPQDFFLSMVSKTGGGFFFKAPF